MNTSEISKLNKILVAVDGSENATRAAEVAAAIASNASAELTILYVIDMPVVPTGETYIPFDKIEDKAREEAGKFIPKLESVAKEIGVKTRIEIVDSFGSVVRTITDYADREKIDLLVVGTRGLGGFKRLVLGSVASGLGQYAHCSGLVVR
ncbi:MAG: universal stress protein [Thaumarchaeota archaeon]|nr:universal stress protein [Nitrososphaerota archaeon]